MILAFKTEFEFELALLRGERGVATCSRTTAVVCRFAIQTEFEFELAFLCDGQAPGV